jgi:plasmid rolling circle replication initiator protein Rep
MNVKFFAFFERISLHIFNWVKYAPELVEFMKYAQIEMNASSRTFNSFLHVHFAKIAADVRFLIKCVENYNALLQNTHRFPRTVCLFIAVFALLIQICVRKGRV